MRNLAHGCRGKHRSFIFLFRIFYRVIETGRTYYNINIQNATSAPKKYLFDTGGLGEYRVICPIFHRLK